MRTPLVLVVALAGCSQLLSFDELRDGAGQRDDGGAGARDGDPVVADACPASPAVVGTPIPPIVVLALDGSASMTLDLGVVPRYQAATQALVAGITALAPRVRFGAVTFASSPACPALAYALPQVDNLAAIQALFEGRELQGHGPLPETFDAIVSAAALVPGAGPSTLVFVTDSSPRTCDTTIAPAATVASVAAAFAAGITLHLIAIDADLTDVDAQAIANAGVGAPPSAASPYARVVDPAGLTAAIASSLAAIDLCRFEPADGAGNETLETVLLDGVALAATEWTREGATVVRLLGEACTAFRTPEVHAIEVRRTCGAGAL